VGTVACTVGWAVGFRMEFPDGSSRVGWAAWSRRARRARQGAASGAAKRVGHAPACPAANRVRLYIVAPECKQGAPCGPAAAHGGGPGAWRAPYRCFVPRPAAMRP